MNGSSIAAVSSAGPDRFELHLIGRAIHLTRAKDVHLQHEQLGVLTDAFSRLMCDD